MINNWVKPLTSLKLTVFCLGCAMILVFLGTLDQVNIGVYEAEKRYFKKVGTIQLQSAWVVRPVFISRSS